jgi:hypothetical protein
VLLCPSCVAEGALESLDRCAACSSTALVRRLGESACRSCGAVDQVAAGAGYADAAPTDRSELETDVAAALERVLRGD